MKSYLMRSASIIVLCNMQPKMRVRSRYEILARAGMLLGFMS